MYTFSPAYPTPQHAAAADTIVAYFANREGIDAVLLTCSCARGRATADSCLDIAILVDQRLTPPAIQMIENEWLAYHAQETTFQAMQQVGRFSHVDLDFFDGRFTPDDYYHGWTTGADAFEVEIGNRFVYTVPLWERDEIYRQMQTQWLPYYMESLQAERLAMVRDYCINNLDHIDLYVPRGLYFQAMQRLWHATGEFLQGLFIARRTYPIAYDKWVREQVVDILDLPSLYPELTNLFEITKFESDSLHGKADQLRLLVERYLRLES